MTIKELRLSTGMSQREFGEFFGISVRTIQEWEQERKSPPSYLINLLKRVLQAENKKIQQNKKEDIVMDYIDVNKDIVNLVVKSKEKFFVLIGENASGKSEILEQLSSLGFFTIDNFRWYDDGEVNKIKDTLEKGEKVIIATHYIREMFRALPFVDNTSVIIATFIDNLYNVASWGDMNSNFISNLIRKGDDETDLLLRKLLNIALFNNWTETSQMYFNIIDVHYLSASQKVIYDLIKKTISE